MSTTYGRLTKFVKTEVGDKLIGCCATSAGYSALLVLNKKGERERILSEAEADRLTSICKNRAWWFLAAPKGTHLYLCVAPSGELSCNSVPEIEGVGTLTVGKGGV